MGCVLEGAIKGRGVSDRRVIMLNRQPDEWGP